MLDDVLFAALAAVVVVATVAILVSRDVVRAAVWLLFTLVGVSLLYFLLGAALLGTVQLIVYVGGTLVLVVFGVMLTATREFLRLRAKSWEWPAAMLAGVTLFGLLLWAVRDAGPGESGGELPGPGPVGLALLGVPEGEGQPLTGYPDGAEPPRKKPTAYLLPFEVVSVHLLVVLIGAAYLARAKRRADTAAE